MTETLAVEPSEVTLGVPLYTAAGGLAEIGAGHARLEAG